MSEASDRIRQVRRLLYEARSELEIAKLDLSDDDRETVADICTEVSEYRRTLGVIAARYRDEETHG